VTAAETGTAVRRRTPAGTGPAAVLRRYAPAALLLVALIGAWELAIRVLDVQSYLFPAPSEVVEQLGEDRELLLDNLWVTVKEVVLGFLIAVVTGIGIAVPLHLLSPVRHAVYPLLIASQTVPVVVLAPVLVVLLGFGLAPKLVIVALTCFFSIVVNSVDGLRSVDPEHVRLMRTLDADRWAIFRRVEFPSALPSIFSGIRIAATYASIGAVFGEWSGSTAGLGYVMLQATPNLQTARIFAAVLLLAAMSLALFLLVVLVERLLVPWARREPIP
jgi:putative hydroxymethylpyrimidine transport system permease protein